MSKAKIYIVLVSAERDYETCLFRYIIESSSKIESEKEALELAKKHYPEYQGFNIFETEEQV